MVETSVHDFVRRYRADARTVAAHYERVKGFKPKRNDILEFEISGANRMVAHWTPPHLTLLAVGEHSTTGSSRRLNPDKLLKDAIEAPQQFWPSSTNRFFPRHTSREYAAFGNEHSREWAYFLDDEQADITESIFNSIVAVLTEPEDDTKIVLDQVHTALRAAGYDVPEPLSGNVDNVHFVFGGPGTGKTCILLNLLKRLTDSGVSEVHLRLSGKVTEYISRSLRLDMSRFTAQGETSRVLLVDDPATASEIEAHCRATGGLPRAVVLAADPLQLGDSLPDETFDQLVESYHASVYELHSCYRQKRHVGELTKKFAERIADSTPFLAENKKADFRQMHERLTRLSNNLRFPNPHGSTDVIEGATSADLKRELVRIRELPGRYVVPLAILACGLD